MSGVPRLYSPNQVSGGVLLGGPIAIIVFLRANFAALGDAANARRVVIYGIAGTFGLALLVAFFPEVPSYPIIAAEVICARMFAMNYQLHGQHDFYSNWRVVGIGLASLIASFLTICVVVFCWIYAGIVLGAK